MRRVEEYVSAVEEHALALAGRFAAVDDLYPILYLESVDEPFELEYFLAVATNDEVGGGMGGDYFRDDLKKQIHAPFRHQPRQANDIDSVSRRSQARIRLVLTRVNSVGNREADVWVHFGAEREIFLACVTHADGCVHVAECPLEKLVKVDAHWVIVEEVNMLGDYGLDP